MNTSPRDEPRDEWSGDRLDRPEMVEAWTTQLRGVLNYQAEVIARIRRDAEAMWKANPPKGYSTFEAWWRHRWVTSPFAELQEHLEKAAALTFQLESRYRRGRHEIPEQKLAAALAKQAPAPALTSGQQGRDQGRSGRPRPAEPREPAPGADFLNLIWDEQQERSA